MFAVLSCIEVYINGCHIHTGLQYLMPLYLARGVVVSGFHCLNERWSNSNNSVCILFSEPSFCIHIHIWFWLMKSFLLRFYSDYYLEKFVKVCNCFILESPFILHGNTNQFFRFFRLLMVGYDVYYILFVSSCS